MHRGSQRTSIGRGGDDSFEGLSGSDAEPGREDILKSKSKNGDDGERGPEERKRLEERWRQRCDVSKGELSVM